MLWVSIAKLLKEDNVKVDNPYLTLIILFACLLVFIAIFFLYQAATQELHLVHYSGALTCTCSVLFIWFASKIKNKNADEIKQIQVLEHYHATHDDLTALPNLSYFREQLESILEEAEAFEDQMALLFIDLKNFDLINETLGYFVGDIILQKISKRIRTSTRSSDIVARVGGDEFAVLINPMIAKGHIHTISKTIADSIQEPLAIEGKPTDVGVSIGVVLYPDHADNSYDLIEKARGAMLVAKKQGDSVFVYEEELVRLNTDDIQIIGMLQRAIQEEQLTILYQPQVRLSDEKITSAEALIRWQHPNYGLLNPDRFIPYAEKAGLIYKINLWMLNNIVSLLAEWHKKDIHLPIAFNITANSFLNNEFQRELNTKLKNRSWLANMLKIELTETSSIENVDAMHAAMTEYKKLGLLFSLDDYGTKHASLEYLKKLPFSELKIDQSFMANAATDEDSRAIIQHAKEIAQQLGLTTTAEGIESKEVLKIAKDYGIINGQGYYFNPALTPNEFENAIK